MRLNIFFKVKKTRFFKKKTKNDKEILSFREENGILGSFFEIYKKYMVFIGKWTFFSRIWIYL